MMIFEIEKFAFISNICKSGPFVSAEGCKYQSVHLYPEIKVLMIEINVSYKFYFYLCIVIFQTRTMRILWAIFGIKM